MMSKGYGAMSRWASDSMEFGDSEIADLLSAATTSHLGGPESVAPPVVPQLQSDAREIEGHYPGAIMNTQVQKPNIGTQRRGRVEDAVHGVQGHLRGLVLSSQNDDENLGLVTQRHHVQQHYRNIQQQTGRKFNMADASRQAELRRPHQGMTETGAIAVMRQQQQQHYMRMMPSSMVQAAGAPTFAQHAHASGEDAVGLHSARENVSAGAVYGYNRESLDPHLQQQIHRIMQNRKIQQQQQAQQHHKQMLASREQAMAATLREQGLREQCAQGAGFRRVFGSGRDEPGQQMQMHMVRGSLDQLSHTPSHAQAAQTGGYMLANQQHSSFGRPMARMGYHESVQYDDNGKARSKDSHTASVEHKHMKQLQQQMQMHLGQAEGNRLMLGSRSAPNAGARKISSRASQLSAQRPDVMHGGGGGSMPPKGSSSFPSGSASPSKKDHSVLLAGEVEVDEDWESATGQGRDMSESPTSKQKFKEFFRQFKAREKESFSDARDYAASALPWLPEKLHWRVLLELADLSKRDNRLDEARALFTRVNELQPRGHQGWLEYAKMEEESGDLVECERILARGVEECPDNESLLLKSVKLGEKMGNLSRARGLLARMKGVGVERAWRVILEGAQMEARQGNTETARNVFKFLLAQVPWHGPVYTEAFRFEERCEETDRAAEIVRMGLSSIPRYGPLWFSAIRLHEHRGDLAAARAAVQGALRQVSKELVWKVFFEAAQMEDRAGCVESARSAYRESVRNCPANLRWKVWIGGARSELMAGSPDVARLLLAKAVAEVPRKMRASVLVECSRLEEFEGQEAGARGVLERARSEAGGEWKVHLESVHMEMRAKNRRGAIAMAKRALRAHSGTGRLWAILIRLTNSDSEKLRIFRRAYREVPKSGEVWCEGARMCLNPLSPLFDLAKARQNLEFAVRFTPQYGDSFIELLRLELLEKGLANVDMEALERLCVNAEPNYGMLWFLCKNHPLDGTRQVLRNAKAMLVEEMHLHRREYQAALVGETWRGGRSDRDLSDVGISITSGSTMGSTRSDRGLSDVGTSSVEELEEGVVRERERAEDEEGGYGRGLKEEGGEESSEGEEERTGKRKAADDDCFGGAGLLPFKTQDVGRGGSDEGGEDGDRFSAEGSCAISRTSSCDTDSFSMGITTIKGGYSVQMGRSMSERERFKLIFGPDPIVP